MNGEKFKYNGCIYHYDKTKDNPFRMDVSGLNVNWDNIDGEIEFTVVEPEPVIERRWKWLKDKYKGYTTETGYMSDSYAKDTWYVESGYYKSEFYIDVEIREQDNAK